jgi:hypothetical protein
MIFVYFELPLHIINKEIYPQCKTEELISSRPQE